MRGYQKIQSGLNDLEAIYSEDWNNHSVRQRAITRHCEQAVQAARDRWQIDLEKQARELAVTSLMDWQQRNGVEMSASPLEIITGKAK